MLNVLSLFSGIGAFESALTRLGIPHRVVNYCEIDEYAAKAYSLIHNVDPNLNLIDVTKVNKINDTVDLITYGFPCQDISIAGYQKGLEHNGEKTRSGLVWDALRIIELNKPKFAICENVKALTSKTFEKEFKAILASLESLGYSNYYKVLNARDYGTPQNRERVFIVSIRKDIDNGFSFPDKIPLTKVLKDVLEPNVPEKYFLTEEQVAKIHFSKYNQTARRIQTKDYTDTLCARDWKSPARVQVSDESYHVSDRIYHPVGLCPTLTARSSIKRIVQIGGIASSNQCYRVYGTEGLAPTLSTCQGGGLQAHILDSNTTRVRKLTPREYLKLMGFTDVEIDRIINEFSNSRLYKMAGNSIVVTVLIYIFAELFLKKGYLWI